MLCVFFLSCNVNQHVHLFVFASVLLIFTSCSTFVAAINGKIWAHRRVRQLHRYLSDEIPSNSTPADAGLAELSCLVQRRLLVEMLGVSVNPGNALIRLHWHADVLWTPAILTKASPGGGGCCCCSDVTDDNQGDASLTPPLTYGRVSRWHFSLSSPPTLFVTSLLAVWLDGC